MKYSDLGLDSRLYAAIQTLGYTDTTPIQDQAFLPIVSGQDVAGLAQTGTGKTAAFLIPLIERILKAETEPEHERAFKDWKAFNTILILVPTRELADQIHENVQKLTAGCGLKSYPLYGGTGYEKQKEALAGNLQFIVSTPGRLIDLYKEHFVDFKKVKAIVFDEADRMFDMGFKDDMKYILSRIERNRQFLVFSATLNFDVLNTAYQFGSEPVEINISKDVAKADNVKDAIFHVGNDEKPQHLLSIFKKENPTQTIIFTNFKNNVDRIAHFLTLNQIPAMGISSLMSQTQRNQVISKFKEINNQNVMVATDVAARGLDILNVDLVINYELPQDCESYVHRIGRTGRAGQEGKAFSLVSEKDVESLYRIEEYTKKKIDIQYLEDADLVKEFKHMAQSEFSYKKPFNKNERPNDRSQGKSNSGGGGSGPRPQRSGPAASAGPAKARPHQPHQRSENHGPKKDHHAKDGHPNTKNKFQKNQKSNGAVKQISRPYRPNTENNYRRKNTPSSAGVLGAVKSFFKKLFN